jgi:peptidoglycan pentaglycine glycine transferase (the first glycine)
MFPYSGTPYLWNELIASLLHAHLLQTWEWSQVKAKVGWQALPFIWQDPAGKTTAAAMVLKRSLPIIGFARKMCILYVPKGPLLEWTDDSLRTRVLDDLTSLARRQGAIFIKLDPDVLLGNGVPGEADATESISGQAIQSDLIRRGWKFSQDQIQFRNTVLVDLSTSEDELLNRMKQKTRYNIRLARKKGVTIRPGTIADLPLLYRMYAETSVRDGFLIREESYYQSVWRTFMAVPPSPLGLQPFAEPLIAIVDGEPVAAVSIFYFARQAIFLFGMSRTVHREKMPNYLLQWNAMLRARELGCAIYNLWGAPDRFVDSDRLWNVFRFKQGLGGVVSRTIGAWDFTPSPILYRLYTEILPRLMNAKRSRGKANTRRHLNDSTL